MMPCGSAGVTRPALKQHAMWTGAGAIGVGTDRVHVRGVTAAGSQVAAGQPPHIRRAAGDGLDLCLSRARPLGMVEACMPSV